MISPFICISFVSVSLSSSSGSESKCEKKNVVKLKVNNALYFCVAAADCKMATVPPSQVHTPLQCDFAPSIKTQSPFCHPLNLELAV